MSATQAQQALEASAGSADLLNSIVDELLRLERLCEQARGPGRHHAFMMLNAARRNLAEAAALVRLGSPNAPGSATGGEVVK